MKKRHYLFLQGQISRFFCELGHSLMTLGHNVHRINFNGGDRQFWQQGNAIDFRGRIDEWPAFVEQQITAWGVTDIVLFGDCRPVHRVAIDAAAKLDVTVHVFEEGYFRPNFITLEQGGVNGYSSLPKTTEALRLAATALPAVDPAAAVASSFRQRAMDDILYNIACLLNQRRFRHYRNHRLWHPFREYWVGARRLPTKYFTRQATQKRIESIVNGAQPYFLFPLQLESDSQIRFHAPPGGIIKAIANVIRSFADHAPADALLVITEHPLDYGPIDLRPVVKQLATTAAIDQRTIFLRGGSPVALVRSATGMVTINSTIGLSALESMIPVIALGKAIYSLPGLVHQGSIDRFWNACTPPQSELLDLFRQVVLARTQINGGFYSRQAIARAVSGSVGRLTAVMETGNRAAPLIEDIIQTMVPTSHYNDTMRVERPSPASLSYTAPA